MSFHKDAIVATKRVLAVVLVGGHLQLLALPGLCGVSAGRAITCAQSMGTADAARAVAVSIAKPLCTDASLCAAPASGVPGPLFTITLIPTTQPLADPGVAPLMTGERAAPPSPPPQA